MSIKTTLLTLLAAAWAAAAPAANITTWHWAPGALVDAAGQPLAPALYYEVFVSSGTEAETLAATVSDTIWQQVPVSGATYRVRVRAVDWYGRRSELSPPSDLWTAPALSGVPGGPAASVGPASPNPFNPSTAIAYSVPDDVRGPLTLQVLDLRGRLVRSLLVDPAPGAHTARWDGRDERGGSAAAGVYLVRFRCGATAAVTKVTLLG